jgi:mannitol/fructose-specific phosphotransferase system IIA component (Ntr-type)
MITIPDALSADHLRLDLHAHSAEEAIAEVAGLLRDDARVVDWNVFFKSLLTHVPCRVADAGAFSICLPHTRTEAVSELVMSAARLKSVVPFTGARTPVRYLFCIGAPKAMASDYLRVAGALMRILSDPVSEERLRTATTAESFLEVLGSAEMKL